MAQAILHALAEPRPIPDRVTLVCAHPDDELVGMGSRLHLFERLRIFQLTDGAPLDMADAHRAGFSSRVAYAEARGEERWAGLLIAGAKLHPEGDRFCVQYSFPDQALVDHLAAVVSALERDLVHDDVVITHAYEGAHPDHDACALAVQLACEQLGEAAPVRLEFAGYYKAGGVRYANRFHPDPACPEVAVELTPAERARKAEAFAAHATQRETLALFPPEREAWRPAPTYDFTRPPPPGEALYDGYGWALSSALWREKAAAALRALDA